jgi:dipeptidyl aminopeptidase/acylaminoacyl peptidase
VLATGIVLPQTAPAQRLRPFTIKDSIEFSQFANPTFWTTNQDRPVEPLISPDGKKALVVTFRGIISNNTIESTIWLFDWPPIIQFAAQTSGVPPAPRVVARFAATSNTPVISDIRWLRDSNRIAFLARSDAAPQQLYVVDTDSGKISKVSDAGGEVSSYDIEGETVVYTTLKDPAAAVADQDDLVAVAGRDIFSLLWRDRPLKDRSESQLLSVQNVLHCIRSGRDVAISATMDDRPIRLFFPMLSLSPDGQSLITVAAVNRIPPLWAVYQSRFGYEELKLTPDNARAFAEDNSWKAAEMVVINLQSGVATPLVNAPAGRSLFFNFAPTKAIWASDSRRVLVSNTFLPIEDATNRKVSGDSLLATATAVAIVDVPTHRFQPVTFFQQPARSSQPDRHVSDITWDSEQDIVTLAYASSPDNVPVSFRKVYRHASVGWTKVQSDSAATGFRVTIEQSLNQPPVLAAWRAGSTESLTIWDPNPQMSSIALGRASLYQWRDKKGTPYTGILVLPPDYARTRRYPLVIQTHGYEPNRFFVDGMYTTGSGGRALAARGVIVLQMGRSRKYVDTPQEGPFQTAAFEGAIKQLVKEGLVDPHRVGVIGFSFTVFHVLYTLTHRPDLFAAASITDGNDLSYWLYLLWADIPWAQQYAERMNGGPKPFGKAGLLRWAQSAPGFNLDRVRAPLMISCLERGTLVSTWDIYGGLRTLNKPVDMVWLRKEDAPHVLIQPRHRYLSQEQAVDWFDFWLNGHEDSDPEKEPMYRRWRSLRQQERLHSNLIDRSPGREREASNCLTRKAEQSGRGRCQQR